MAGDGDSDEQIHTATPGTGSVAAPPRPLKDAVAGRAAGLFGDLPPERRIPLTGSPLDRAAHLRMDDDGRAAMIAGGGTEALPLWQGRPAVRPDGRLALLSPAALGSIQHDPAELVFLGHIDGAARLAVDLSDLAEDAAIAALASAAPEAVFEEPRAALRRLSPDDGAIFAEAKSLTDWSRTHRACARCGSTTRSDQGGWRRVCPFCGARHFPRTDPVVIMLAVRPAAAGRPERVLLGRQHAWPPGLHSLLAGYVEPGESIEEAARREIAEESGVAVGRVSYIASQPWPFPSTLMIGVYAEALSDDLTPDPDELESARWATRAEMAEVFADAHPEIRSPRPDAIARALLLDWVEGRFDP